jgi:tetratricopeptide (TPR) repeat protein
MKAMITSGSRNFRQIALLSLLLGIAAATRAADNWIEVRSPHFIVVTNASEKEARRIADQFELIRATFHSAFGILRMDPAQTIVILAAKNEATMKLLLPEEWEDKKRVHHAGMYQPGPEKHYVILRTDQEGNNPYHTLYHEYTHALLHLNFRHIPLWLDEGMAEYLGNAILSDKKEVRIGVVDPGHLYVLQQNKLLPIEVLLSVDHNSPYYNEQNRASVFYAESWALVHFLMFDQEARRKQLFKQFLQAFVKSNDQTAAAREAFGDLKRFGQTIDAYARRTSFSEGVFKPPLETADKNYSVRALSSGEVLALRGDFFVHHNRAEQAKPLLDEALKAEPSLAFAHEAMGYYHYRRREIENARKEMAEALRLGSQSYVVPYFHATLTLMGDSDPDDSVVQEVTSELEKAIQLNPLFAPAFDALAQLYACSPEKQLKAVETEMKALQLEPGSLSYAFHLTQLLMNNNRNEEARALAERILAAAKSPQDVQAANALLRSVRQRAEWAVRGVGPGSTMPPQGANEKKLPAKEPTWKLVDVEGTILSAECSENPELVITLSQEKGPLRLSARRFKNVQMSFPSTIPTPSPDNCAQWKGRKVKVRYFDVSGTENEGQVVTIYFF